MHNSKKLKSCANVEIIKRKIIFMKNFTDFPLLPEIQKSLDALGFTQPTEIQEKVIPFLLESQRDIHAQAQTGTGKTIAFGIPLLQTIDRSLKSVQGLIIAPTRELVLQIYEHLKDVSRGMIVNIEPVYGGMPINQQIRNIKHGAQIIVGTPGRLNDHLRRRTLSLKNLKVLVLDEADIMLDMGFKEEIDSILKNAPENRLIWLFSATVRPGIRQLINSHMNNVEIIKASKKDVITSQVKQYFCVVPRRNRTATTARFIEATPNFYGIIFCQTKILTNEVMEQLASRGFRVNCLHGDMSQSLRTQIIKGFKNKDFNILVATDVAARGIDVSDLTHVINFSIPEEHENYIHRIGRTGRAGKEGTAIVFAATSEMYKIRRLEKAAQTKLQEIPIPSLDTIIDAKMSAVSDFVEQSKEPDKKSSTVHSALNKLIDSFTPEEIRLSLIIALEDKFFKDIVHEKNLSVNPDNAGKPQEICIEIGRDDGFTEDMIRNYLYSTCKLSPQEIHKARVLNKKTFISVSPNRLRDCFNIMLKTPVTERKPKVYLVVDTYDTKESRSPRRSDRRGDRRSTDRKQSFRKTSRR